MNKCTTAVLAEVLNAALVRHIHSCLPDIKQRVADAIFDVEQVPRECCVYYCRCTRDV